MIRSKNDNKTEEKKINRNIFCIAKGTIIAILISIVLVFIMSVILTISNISESVIPISVIVISSIGILVGSIISAINLKKNGLLNGGIVGLLYIITIYLLSSIIILDFSLNIKTLIMIIVSIVIGMIGGIIGVNIRKN